MEAARYLGRAREGYDLLLLEEYEHVAERAARLPKSGTAVAGFHERHDVRRFSLQRFRYHVVTAIVSGERIAIAFAHMKRRPGYWADRLKQAQ